MKKKLFLSQKGQILIFIVIVLASLLIAISAMLNYVSISARFSQKQIRYTKGIYRAEEGIQYLLYYIKGHPYTEISFGNDPPYKWTLTKAFEQQDVDLVIYNPAYEDRDDPGVVKPWDPDYDPVFDSDFDSSSDFIIYYVTSEAQIGENNPRIEAIVKRRLYSAVEIETVDEELKLIFKRYKSSKILEIDY